MGNASSEIPTQLVVFDSEIVESSREVFNKWNIKPIVYDDLSVMFENAEASQLKSVLTSDEKKSEMIAWMKNYNLVKSKLYVYIKDRTRLNRQDEENPAIFMMSTDLEELLESIKKKNDSVSYNPLALLNREMKVKVQVRIIEYDTNSIIFQNLYNGLVKIGASVQVCKGFQGYKNSIYSISDFVVCRRCRQASAYEDKKPFEMIYYDQIQEPKFGVKSVASLIEFVRSNKLKSGYRMQPISKVLILNRRENKHSQEKIEKQRLVLRRIKENYSQILFQQCTSNQELLRALKTSFGRDKANYMSILFIHSRSKNITTIRNYLRDLNMNRRVMVLTLASFPLVYHQKQEKTKKKRDDSLLLSTIRPIIPNSLVNNYNLFYRIQKKIPRAVDFIDKNIKSQTFEIFKQHLMVYNIGINQYESHNEYEDVLGKTHNPFVICGYRTYTKLKPQIDKHRKQNPDDDIKIICFDAKDKSMMIKQERVFDLGLGEYVFATDKIKDVSDFIIKNPLQQLILQETSHQKEIECYNSIVKKYQTIVRKGTIVQFQTEITEKNYTSYQQVGFIKDPGYNERWPAIMKDFLVALVELWKLDYVPINDIQYLKQHICKALRSLYRNEAIQTTDKVFYSQYICQIKQCRNLSDLSQRMLYLCSLPHGLNTSLNYLLGNFSANLRAINLLKPILFLLMMNFCMFFQPNYQMEKKTFQVYYNSFYDKNDKVDVELKVGEKLYNTNFLECWENVYQLKDYIEIEYQYYPLAEMSPYYNLIRTEIISFYKSGAEYSFSPYSCFEIKQVSKLKGKQVIKLKHIPNYTFMTLLMQKSFNCANPILDLFLPAIANQQKAIASRDNFKSKEEAAVYFEFITALSNNRILEAQHKFQEDRKRDYKNIHGKTFKAIEEVFVLVKKGQYQEARSKVQTIESTLESKLEHSLNSLGNLISRVIKAREIVLDKTNFYIFPPKQSKEDDGSNYVAYKWESKYENSCDQFALSQVGQGDDGCQLSFIRVPEKMSMVKNTCQSEDTVLARVLEFTNVKKELVKPDPVISEQNQNIFLGLMSKQIKILQQQDESDSSEQGFLLAKPTYIQMDNICQELAQNPYGFLFEQQEPDQNYKVEYQVPCESYMVQKRQTLQASSSPVEENANDDDAQTVVSTSTVKRFQGQKIKIKHRRI